MSNEEAVAWADEKLLNDASLLEGNASFEFLADLSLNGLANNTLINSPEFPSAKVLTYSECFALRAQKLNLNSKKDVIRFIEWVISASLGENLDLDEVMFGYHLDEDYYCTNNQSEAVNYFHLQFPILKKQTQHLA
ncbi:MAG: hypothetical protein GY787_32565, partial [Alteromonadales bacterium]|nr:hypothetical protein [Alteromonadales bacterium]